MKKLLTIAGSDSSGGAGIQADIKTFSAHLTYGMSVITALTAQNTQGVYDIEVTEDTMVLNQLDAIFKDIFPDAVKIGMISKDSIVKIVADKLKEYKPKFVVLDPVMVSTSGHNLSNNESVELLKEELFPLSTIITPNIPEAEVLSDMKISTVEDMKKSCLVISKMTYGAVLIKGGHLVDEAIDILYYNDTFYEYKNEMLDNPNTHGTGCTLSSAIAVNLAKGFDVPNSVKNAKDYVFGAIKSGLDIGNGRGPLNHFYRWSDSKLND